MHLIPSFSNGLSKCCPAMSSLFVDMRSLEPGRGSSLVVLVGGPSKRILLYLPAIAVEAEGGISKPYWERPMDDLCDESRGSVDP